MDNTHKIAGVMGWPVAHSRSPVIHNYWIKQHGLSGAYGLFPVKPENLERAIRGLQALGIAGCNITIPHKVNSIQFVDWVDPLAKRIGAINTIVVQPDGELHGFNHDGFGYIQSLLDVSADWQANTGPIVVLGAGGASRAILVSLIDQGAAEIRLLNRTRSKADELAQEFGPVVTSYGWNERQNVLCGASLLVNTTSQGMSNYAPLDLDLSNLPTSALVSDAIYTPLETPLLSAARIRGNKTVNGLGMLLHQARPAFKSWFGVMPEVCEDLRQSVTRNLSNTS